MLTPDSADEARLVRAVEKVGALVDAGEAPDAAVEKVARAEGFAPGHIRLLGHGYNVGRQLHQWRADGSTLDKLAGFPLAGSL